jgi:hypothetical protein
VCVCVCVCVCVRACIEHLGNLQHAQRGVQNAICSRDGRVANMFPHVFSPEECVCGQSF